MAKFSSSPKSAWGRAASAGLEAGIAVALGLFIGYHADRWLGTEPWLLLLFMIAGFIAGMRRLFKMAHMSMSSVPDAASSSASPGAESSHKGAAVDPSEPSHLSDGTARKAGDDDSFSP